MRSRQKLWSLDQMNELKFILTIKWLSRWANINTLVIFYQRYWTSEVIFFLNNYDYLCRKARDAMFCMMRKLKSFGQLPPKIMIYLFNATIKPILLYGADIWGIQKSGSVRMDKFFLWYLRSILKVKTTTANNIVWGETGCIPLSVCCNVKVFCYYNRLRNLPDTMLVKWAFN